MKKLLFAAVAAAISLPALAADLPVKANRLLAYPTGCGLFYGVNTMGSGGGAAGASFTGSQVLAGDVGLSAGYTCPLGDTFWFVEGMFDVTRMSGGGPGLGGISASATFEQRAAIGAPLSTISALSSLLPGLGGIALPSIPMLPAGVSAGAANPYAFVSLHEQDVSAQVMTGAGKSWLFSWGAGVGALTRLSNGMVLDTWVEYQAASTGLRLGAVGGDVKIGDSVRAGVALKL